MRFIDGTDGNARLAMSRQAMGKSINQLAQEEGDSSANEARRIREREAQVKKAWRTVAFYENEAACTAERIARESDLPVDYVRFVCGKEGLALR